MRTLSQAAKTALAALALTSLSSRPAAADSLAPETGWNHGEIEPARTTAVGGAVRALGSGVGGLYANPANMALTRVYHLQALGQIWPEAKRQTYGATAVDSVTSRLAGGLGAHYGMMDPDGIDRRWTDVRLGLAVPFSDKVFAGVAGRYFKLSQDGTGPLGSSFASSGLAGDPMLETFTFDAGLTFKPSDQLGIGIVGSNLTNPGHGLLPTMLGGGIGFGTLDFTLEGDVVADFTSYTDASGAKKPKLRTMGGVEYLAGDHYPLRVGYVYDAGATSHAVSGGLGYVDTMFSLELAMRRTVSGPDSANPATAVIIDLQYFLESSGVTRSPIDVE